MARFTNDYRVSSRYAGGIIDIIQSLTSKRLSVARGK